MVGSIRWVTACSSSWVQKLSANHGLPYLLALFRAGIDRGGSGVEAMAADFQLTGCDSHTTRFLHSIP